MLSDLLTPGDSAEVTSHAYRMRLVAAMLGAGILIGVTLDAAKFGYVGLAQAVKVAMTNRAFASQAERIQYRRMQTPIPENALVLTRLDKPFLLDFKRNTIFIVDHPNGMPPSIPRFKQAEPFAKYLLGRSIRYVAYSYRNEAGVPRKLFGGPDSVAAHGSYYTYDLEFQHMLEELGQSRQRIYDDGDNFVVDLCQMRTQL